MSLVQPRVLLSILILALPWHANGGMIFLSGHVETRAFSGLTPELPTDVHAADLGTLPYTQTMTSVVGSTFNQTTYDLSAGDSGGLFGWVVGMRHDGARDSFALAEGTLSFRVDEPADFLLQGAFSHLGPGVKRFFLRLYDTPADISPVFNWDVENSSVEDGAVFPEGGGSLVPGVNYRLVYRMLLDNRNAGDPGAAVGEIEFIAGTSPDEAFPGDTNGDGQVDLVDLNAVRNHFGEQGEGVEGDTSPFDGVVDLADLNAVRNNFGQSAGLPAPEPASISLLCTGVACAALWFCRRGRAAETRRHDFIHCAGLQ